MNKLLVSCALDSAVVTSVYAATTVMTAAPSESWTVTNYDQQAVYGPKENKIGDVDDVLVDKSGKVTIVVGVGGYLFILVQGLLFLVSKALQEVGDWDGGQITHRVGFINRAWYVALPAIFGPSRMCVRSRWRRRALSCAEPIPFGTFGLGMNQTRDPVIAPYRSHVP